MLSRFSWVCQVFNIVQGVITYVGNLMKLKVMTRTVFAVTSVSYGITGDMRASSLRQRRFTGFVVLASNELSLLADQSE